MILVNLNEERKRYIVNQSVTIEKFVRTTNDLIWTDYQLLQGEKLLDRKRSVALEYRAAVYTLPTALRVCA